MIKLGKTTEQKPLRKSCNTMRNICKTF